MPVKYVCKKCGITLWLFKKVGQDYYGIPSPEEITRIYGICPNCKKEIAIPQFNDIVVQPLNSSLQELMVVKREIPQEA